MNCHAFDSVLDYFFDKRLLPDLESKIKAHGDSCSRCSKKIQVHLAYQNILKQEVLVPVNIDLPEAGKVEKTIDLRDWLEQPAEGFSLAYGIALVSFCLNPFLNLINVGIGGMF